MVLFETDGSGDAELAIDPDGTRVTMRLSDAETVSLRVEKEPETVLVDGDGQPFEYDAETRCVTVAVERRVRKVTEKYMRRVA